jgi:hypothetical protein
MAGMRWIGSSAAMAASNIRSASSTLPSFA